MMAADKSFGVMALNLPEISSEAWMREVPGQTHDFAASRIAKACIVISFSIVRSIAYK